MTCDLRQQLKDLSVSFSLIHPLPSEEAGPPCLTLQRQYAASRAVLNRH